MIIEENAPGFRKYTPNMVGGITHKEFRKMWMDE
jgi:hypothetical protein